MSFVQRPLGQKGPSGVSKALRDFARGQECTLRLPCCNHDPETTIHAHLRYFGWAGIAQKPVDFLGIHACSSCHAAQEDKSLEAVGFEDLLRAMGETQLRLHRAGLLKMKGDNK